MLIFVLLIIVNTNFDYVRHFYMKLFSGKDLLGILGRKSMSYDGLYLDNYR